MNPELNHSFAGFMRGLFGTRHGRSMPAFVNERVLRDIGLLEPENYPVQGEDLADMASQHRTLSIGLSGL